MKNTEEMEDIIHNIISELNNHYGSMYMSEIKDIEDTEIFKDFADKFLIKEENSYSLKKDLTSNMLQEMNELVSYFEKKYNLSLYWLKKCKKCSMPMDECDCKCEKCGYTDTKKFENRLLNGNTGDNYTKVRVCTNCGYYIIC